MLAEYLVIQVHFVITSGMHITYSTGIWWVWD